MTREEAIEILENWKICHYTPSREAAEVIISALDPLEIITALRPVSREQVEKVWRGCEYCKKRKIKLVRIEMDYNETPGSPKRLNPTRIPKFCPICGAPMTDEAVEMVLERMEALYEQ